ncbi:MAG: hypothetical protein PHH08_01895 [Candidatus ainarchaeum sp.]|nr:hypothetical protein [Candidatus ainarchaeum sp.]
MDCKKPFNEKNCPCGDTSCKRHGICCECISHHRDAKNLPHCLRQS